MTIEDLQGNEVMTFVISAIVEKEGVLSSGGKPVTENDVDLKENKGILGFSMIECPI